jgi:site-specific DNA-methyltransferase (adenine-specific)
MKFDRKQSANFRQFYTEVSKEAFRVLKPGGAFLSFSSPRLYHAMASGMEDAGFEIRDMLGWVYTQSQVKAFSQDHIISNDKTRTPAQKEELKKKCSGWKTPQLKPAIEPICFAVKPIEGRYIDNFDKYGTGLMDTTQKVGEDYFPSNILLTDDTLGLDKVFLVPKAKKEKYNTHLSVKPVDLILHLVKLFTIEGALVLDPFMGSGTTAVACIQSKRNYLGFDTNTEYIDIATRRAREATPQ